MSDLMEERPDDGEEPKADEAENEGWDETNDEPAEGEGDQDIV